MRKIKILFAIHRFSVGGAEKFLIHHFRHIDRQRYDVRLVTIFDEKKAENTSCADETHINHCFHFQNTWDLRGFIELVKYLRKERFDVVVTHLFIANLLVRTAAIVARIPTIISYEHNIYPNKHLWQIAADKILALFTDKIVADSDAAKNFTSRQEMIPLEKFQTIIIPPLLDNRSRRSREQVLADLGIPPQSLIVVTVSRLVVDKGHKYLVEAASSVLQKHENAYFLIGGWGPLEADLKEQVQNLGVEGHVSILGRVDGQEFMSIADLYVDPSISTDLPIGIMEAMTKSKAIVATTVGEIPNFVMHEKTGLTVPPYDSPALAAAIDRMLADEPLRIRFGDAAKIKVDEYSMENYVKTFDELVASCMGT